MKILLVNPPLVPISELSPPVGLCTLASFINRKHFVKILDIDLRLRNTPLEVREHMMSCFFEMVHDYEPDIIGFTSMYNNSFQAEQLIRASKVKFPHIPTVAGGAHFGAQGIEALNKIPELDFIIEGEGELGLQALLDYLQGEIPVSEVPNLCYRKGEEIIVNARAKLMSLSQIEPIWPTLGSVLDLEAYSKTIPEGSKRRAIYIEAGRGCPYSCTFCAPAQFWERKYRVKSVSTIVEEIHYLYEQFGYNSFLLIHDLLTADKNFIRQFSEALKEASLPIEWMANARADINLNDVLPLMKESGCWKLFYGIESASEKVQQEIKKGLSRQEILNSISHASASGIDSTCSFVIGFENESPEELSATIALGSQLKLIGAETVQYHRLRFFPPAPLSKIKGEKDFDMETLKLEFPFQNITESEIENIKSSEFFYLGYFAPVSKAGKASELSQVELFFQQAVSLAPLTVNAISYFAGGNLIKYFYNSLSDIGPIDRYSIDWLSNDMLAHWKVVLPYLKYLCRKASPNGSARKMLDAIMKYEEIRLKTVVGKKWGVSKSLFSSDGCVIFTLPVNIFEIIDCLKKNQALNDVCFEETNIMFVRSLTGEVSAFMGVLADSN